MAGAKIMPHEAEGELGCVASALQDEVVFGTIDNLQKQQVLGHVTARPRGECGCYKVDLMQEVLD